MRVDGGAGRQQKRHREAWSPAPRSDIQRLNKLSTGEERAADLNMLQNLEDLRVIRIAAPVEGEGEGAEARVAGQDVHRLQGGEGIVREVEGVKELHVGDAVACVDQVVAEVHGAQEQVEAKALRWRLEGG